MALVPIFNTASCPSHAGVALQSDPTFSNDPSWVQEELRKRLIAEQGFKSANRAVEERKSQNGVYQEREEKTGSSQDEDVRSDAIKKKESPIALQGGGAKEKELSSIDFEHKPCIPNIGNDADASLSGLLKACADKEDLERGRHIHSDIVRRGDLQKNVFIGSSLVNFYAKCGALEEAQVVFDELPIHSRVSWNALIGGYVQHARGNDALNCYDRMKSQGFSIDTITFLYILKACGSAAVLDKGQYVHSHIIKAGLLEDVRVGTALVDMYFKCGSLSKAQKVFDGFSSRDVVSWTTLILGYTQHDYGEEALKCFEQMQREGLCPDALTSACILKACGSIGATYEGQRIHADLVRGELLEKDMVAGSALVDMYANCGMLAEAQEVFDNLLVKNVVSWSALMEGYAQLGKDELVFSLFDKMRREGTKPSWVTFTIVLNACCHRGLLDKAKVYFEQMSRGCNIVPTINHHTCMVDLFCRAGQLDKAIAMIKEMPICANSTLWHTMLDACQRCGNMKIGRWAFERVLELNEKDARAYVSLNNLDASRQTHRQGQTVSYKSKKARVERDWT